MARKTPKIVKEIQNHQTEKINYAFQKNISYSQYSMYKTCPHQWALQYKDGYKTYTPTIYTVFGTALHEAIQYYLTILYEQSGAAADREDILGIFEDAFRKEYGIQYKKNKNQHFSNAEEMGEFFEDGEAIINIIKKKRNLYFTKKNVHLVGCEVPIMVSPNRHYNHVIYQGYLDVVLYDERDNKFKIIDIKSSTKKWITSFKKTDPYKENKKDKLKQKSFQLLLYKKYFGEQFGIPEENIDIEFFIAKRKIYTEGDFQEKRIQIYAPPNKKGKINEASKAIDDFIEDVFNKKGYKEKDYKPTPSKWNCTFCPFKENKDLCSVSM